MNYNLNGYIIRNKHLSIQVNNRGLNYGDGIFETLKYSRKRFNFWEDHYFRLMASMRIVRMEIPMDFSPEYLEEQMLKALNANQLEEQSARVKILVVRKAGGYYSPKTNEIDFLITVEPLTDASYTLNEQGLEVDLFKDFYKLSGLLGNLKSTSSQLYTIAGVFAQENNLDDVLLLNEKKEVIESTKANIFLVKGDDLITPPLESGCLKGIMRKQIIELAPQLGFTVKEEAFSPFALQKADELWLTNSVQGLQWVGKYRKKTFADQRAQEMVKRLNVKLALSLD
ncbi:MAG: aminotransferase class IV [Bacteroidetes bacterium]|nr:aminotransferase class IV [Bacteroidota bacterium]